MVTMVARSMGPLSRTSLRPAVRPSPVCGLRAERPVLHNRRTSCHEQASRLHAMSNCILPGCSELCAAARSVERFGCHVTFRHALTTVVGTSGSFKQLIEITSM